MRTQGHGSALAPQHGVAIVLAMGVVALAALTATAMMVSQSTWSRQAELSTGHVQAQLLIQAGLDWSRAILSDDRRVSAIDHLGEPWALRLPPIPVENGTLAGRIEDQQGKFNLNNLLKGGRVDLVELARFRRLLSILALPPALADALAGRIEADRRPLTDTAELALLRGFNDERVRARLRPFVAALPRSTAVNANTASPEVLAAVVEGLDLDGARAMVAQRERVYFRSFSEFFRQLPPGLIVPTQSISVSSNYFIATMHVKLGGAQARGAALLARGDGAGWPAILWSRMP
jgi:general secretion pathway protein K